MKPIMKAYVIEGRRGFYHIKETIANYHFPAGWGSRKAATQYPSQSIAQKRLIKHKLNTTPNWAHVEQIEI